MQSGRASVVMCLACFGVGCGAPPADVRSAAGTSAFAGTGAAASDAAGPTPELTGSGTAAIDGVLSPGEWDLAATVDFLANVPESDGGGTVPARLYVMNDAANLYFAVRFEASFHGGASLAVELDSNGDGIVSHGDDVVVASAWAAGGQSFADDFRWTCGAALCGVRDTDVYPWAPPPGTEDGAGAVITSGGITFAEISHPLASGDAIHDAQLAPGDAIGIRISVRNLDSCAEWPSCYGDTDFPVGSPLVVRIAGAEPPAPVTALIDVKPPHPDSPAPLNLGARGTVPVAILGAATFDVGAVDVASVSFAGAPVATRPGGTRMAAVEDVNGDGIADLVLHFESAALQLAPDATTAALSGIAAGAPFEGEDEIRIVP